MTVAEKEHTKTYLMQQNKEELAQQIICLEHNINALHETIEQQQKNFKEFIKKCYDNLERKTFSVDFGHTQSEVVKIVEVEDELLPYWRR